MFDDYLELEDKVKITIPQENRDWGYNPCPDGTLATIIGFTEIHWGRVNNCGIKPGVYVNRAWVKVRLEDGKEHTELSSRLELVDKAEHERRVAEGCAKREADPHAFDHGEFLRDLPETPFWEGDMVFVPGAALMERSLGKRNPHLFQVIGINYSDLNETTRIGTKYPAYNIASGFSAGWHTGASEDSMTLVERGPVWKHYHNEPIVFASLEEEASFYHLLGHTEEVRNPASGLYAWTLEELLTAVRNGQVHGFSGQHNAGNAGPVMCAIRYKDAELGRRVAEVVLASFDR
ncbi:MAG: hypothetical protein NUV56_00335 [Candidatus Uhrbacteria bacterium]|nr:hypothetical protein [Candidatus Uhrbacteria bacterium]